MRKFYVLLVALLMVSGASAQSCLPEGILFSMQAQIDNFQSNYPNCTEIEGNVSIHGSDITNLNGLSVLTSIGGNLYFGYTEILNSLAGLQRLTSIGGKLEIQNNKALTNLSGLDSLTTIGGSLDIFQNEALTSLLGLNSLTRIGGVLGIRGNLTSLTGLANLTSIGDGLYISENTALNSLAGLENVTSIGGDLLIYNNNILTSISGLYNITADSITNLSIYANPSLITCDIKSLCDYLGSPNGTIEIHDNASGCNSQEEVHLACTFGLHENSTSESHINISPNPTSTQITISTPTTPNKNTSLTIYNISGQVILSRQIMEPLTNVDVSGLVSGVYFVKVADDRTVQVGKFVKQ